MATAVAADPAAFNRKGDAASTVLELEEEAARCAIHDQQLLQLTSNSILPDPQSLLQTG